MVTELNNNTVVIGDAPKYFSDIKSNDFIYIDCPGNAWDKSMCVVSRIFKDEVHLFSIKFPWTFFKAKPDMLSSLKMMTIKE